MKGAALLSAALLFAAPLAFAQTDELRNQIRADLLRDPRTASLSSAELDALITVLASEAEATGEASTYLDAKTSPVFTYDPPPEGETVLGAILSAPIIIAISSLVAAMAYLALIIVRRQHRTNVNISTEAST